MSGDVVARAKAALEGVTDGPWMQRVDPCGCYSVDTKPDLTVELVAEGIASKANGGFIAESRSLVPGLVAEVEKLRGAIETIRDTLNNDELGYPAQMADIRGKVHDTIGFDRAGIEP